MVGHWDYGVEYLRYNYHSSGPDSGSGSAQALSTLTDAYGRLLFRIMTTWQIHRRVMAISRRRKSQDGVTQDFGLA